MIIDFSRGAVAVKRIQRDLDNNIAVAATLRADVDGLLDDVQTVPDTDELPRLCGQPSILFGNGTPQAAIVPDNWIQLADGGYNWNGVPSALGQQYINYAVNTGGRYIAVRDGAYGLKWINS